MITHDLHARGYARSVQSFFQYSAEIGLGMEPFQEDYLPGTFFSAHETLTISSGAQVEEIIEELVKSQEDQVPDCGYELMHRRRNDALQTQYSAQDSGLTGFIPINALWDVQACRNPFEVYSTIILADGIDFGEQGPISAYHSLSNLMKTWTKAPVTDLVILAKVLDTDFVKDTARETESKGCDGRGPTSFGSVRVSVPWFQPQNVCLTLGKTVRTCCTTGASLQMISGAASIIGESSHGKDAILYPSAVLHGTHGGMLYIDWEVDPFYGQMTYQVHIDFLKSVAASRSIPDDVCITQCWEHFVNIQYHCIEACLDVVIFGASEEDFAELNSGRDADYEIDGELYTSDYITLKRAMTAPGICRGCCKPWLEG